MTERVLETLSSEDRARQITTGSMMPIVSDPFFAEIIAWPKALAALAALGFASPTFSDGYIISKPPHSPRLFWHYDWFAWEDPRSHEPVPPQVFLMYYLTDTRPENGCLRVIPGSHRTHNPLHDVIDAPHSKELAEGEHLDRVEFSRRPDEVDVPIKAGDLLLGDARLLHATHANNSDEGRTLLTLWYQPDLKSLPERMQAQMAAKAQRIPRPGRQMLASGSNRSGLATRAAPRLMKELVLAQKAGRNHYLWIHTSLRKRKTHDVAIDACRAE